MRGPPDNNERTAVSIRGPWTTPLRAGVARLFTAATVLTVVTTSARAAGVGEGSSRHEPRFSSGQHGDAQQMSALWNDLATDKADIVLSGHNHDYERFDPLGSAPQDPNAVHACRRRGRPASSSPPRTQRHPRVHRRHRRQETTQAVKELSSALELADHFAYLSARLRANLQQVLDAFDALTFSTPAHSEDPAASLSEHDEAVLRETGSLAYEMPPLAERASAKTAMRTVQLLEDALTVQQVADVLKVSPGRVRQRLSKRTLLGIDVAGNWKLPKFQFTADGEVRGLDQVLPGLPSDVHPLVLWRFLTTPHPDLILENEAVSPGTWMSTGGSVEPVLELAADLHSLV